MPYWILAALVLGLVVASGDNNNEAQAEAEQFFQFRLHDGCKG